jgi:hypothetical protein
MLDASAQFPGDATIEDTTERLYILEGLEREIVQVESLQVVTNDQAKKRLSTWLR